MNLISKISVFGLALLCVSCGRSQKEEALTVAPVEVKPGSIAYVVEDSVQNNYQYLIDAKAALESKAQSYQSSMAQKEQTLQNLQKSIQTRMQNGQISTEAQYKQEMQSYQKQENAYMQYRQQVMQEMAEEEMAVQKALQDSVNNFLAEYNKTKKCSLILYKSAILHAGSAIDITQEVVAGLNKRYKKQ